jgi:predicted dehydrogenase
MDEIRIAVVGLGGRGLGWMSLLQRVGGYRITAICDPVVHTHEAAMARVEHSDQVKRFERYEEVLASDDVDAIALTVRCEDQGGLAAKGLEAGKHVNMEVPGAHNMEDCWRIVAAQERTGKVFQLAEQCRHAGYIDEWRRMVADGELGKITYCEGQYFHYYAGKSFRDPNTGTFYGPADLADHPEAEPTWMYHMPPIHYLPHDLGPMLKVLDDRVVEVVGMSTDSPSDAHPELAGPDMQIALMKTEKGALMRMGASFSSPHPPKDYHWQQVIGTKGSVEWKRTGSDMPKMWLADGQMIDKVDVDWKFERADAPDEAKGSGHADMDYYVHAAFRDAVFGKRELEYDVYKAMETSAPPVLASESISQDGKKLRVPSFLPGPERAKGELPKGQVS